MHVRTVFLGALASLGFAGTANAAYVPATWTDTYDVGTGVYIPSGGSYSYFHDITFDGFQIGSDIVTSFKLSIDLFDDQRDPWWEFEFPEINLPGYDGDVWLFETIWGGFTLAGLAHLNLAGTFDVTISAGCDPILGIVCGDFYFGGSELVAKGYSKDATAVPAPGTLGLFGVGLLGAALAARRRRRTNI